MAYSTVKSQYNELHTVFHSVRQCIIQEGINIFRVYKLNCQLIPHLSCNGILPGQKLFRDFIHRQ